MDDDASSLEVTHGASDVSGRHVVTRVLVESHQENSVVMTVRGKDDEIVERLEVSVVSVRTHAARESRVLDGLGRCFQ